MLNDVINMINNNDFLKKNINGLFPIVDHNFLKLMMIGGLTGIIASFVGGGAEIVIVPLLVYLNVINDYKTAIGTSLASFNVEEMGTKNLLNLSMNDIQTRVNKLKIGE